MEGDLELLVITAFLKSAHYSDAKAPKQANLGALASEYFMNRQVRYPGFSLTHSSHDQFINTLTPRRYAVVGFRDYKALQVTAVSTLPNYENTNSAPREIEGKHLRMVCQKSMQQ